MSHVLDRLGAFFLDPPPAEPAAPSDSGAPTGDPATPSVGPDAVTARDATPWLEPGSPREAPPSGEAPPSRCLVPPRGAPPPRDIVPPRGAPPPRDIVPPRAAAARCEAGLWREAAPTPEAAATREVASPRDAASSGESVGTPREAGPTRFAPPVRSAGPPAPPDPAPAAFAVVLGAPGVAVPVAAAVAGELRAQARATAAVVCVWGVAVPPAGASTPTVRRLAARHAAHGGDATACGRLVWLALDPDPDVAASHAARALAVGGGPVVLAAAGPRPAAFEPLLHEADLAIAVLPADAEEALRTLALATLPARAALTLPPLPPGPPRWAAMAGLARLRSLKRVRT